VAAATAAPPRPPSAARRRTGFVPCHYGLESTDVPSMPPHALRPPPTTNDARGGPLPPQLPVLVIQSAHRLTLGIAADSSSGSSMARRRRLRYWSCRPTLSVSAQGRGRVTDSCRHQGGLTAWLAPVAPTESQQQLLSSYMRVPQHLRCGSQRPGGGAENHRLRQPRHRLPRQHRRATVFFPPCLRYSPHLHGDADAPAIVCVPPHQKLPAAAN